MLQLEVIMIKWQQVNDFKQCYFTRKSFPHRSARSSRCTWRIEVTHTSGFQLLVNSQLCLIFQFVWDKCPETEIMGGRKIREELGFWNILPLNLDGQLCLREREIWIQMRCQHQKGKCRTTSLNIRSIEYVLLSSLFVWKKTNQTFSSDLFSLPQPPAILSYTTRLLSQILRHRGSVSNLFRFKKRNSVFFLKPGFYHLVLLLRV